MVDSKNVSPNPPAPAPPGTSGAPFFGGFNIDESPNVRRSIPNNCSCFSANACVVQEGSMGTTTSKFMSSPISLARKVGAEFIGTLILIFAGAATAIVNQKTQGSVTLLGLAASGGLAVMIVVLSTGHISGAHLNPSVTVAFAALKRFPWKQVPMYIGAQVVGSICAAFALKGVFHPFMGGGVTVPTGSYSQAFAMEFIISFILMFVVTAIATDTRAVGELAGIAVGAVVMLNNLIAGETSGASMNPVRTLGPAIAANNYKAIWVYLTAPILGSLCGAGAYSAIKLPEDETRERSSIWSLRRRCATGQSSQGNSLTY